MQKFNTLDLFCGCGGLSKGLSLNKNIKIVAGIDVWDKAIESYTRMGTNTRMGHRLAIVADLTKLSPKEFSERYNIENVDILAGAPSCQSYSIAGKRDENDPRSSLFMEYVKYLDFYNPKAFIFENVVGILSAKTSKGEKVVDILQNLLSKNYDIKIMKLYASDFRVPQNRRRVFIIGFRKDLKIILNDIEYPIKNIKDRVPVKTILQPREEISETYYLSEKAIEGIKKRKEKMLKKGNGFGAQFLDFDKPSFTITANYWHDGSGALVYYDENNIRRLTILELKRIQTFPDNYILAGSKKDQITQIGNAVPCKLAYYVGRYVVKKLLNK